jgi:hypothetical protein
MRKSVWLLALLAVGLLAAGGTARAAHEGESPIQLFVKAADPKTGLVKLARRFDVVDGMVTPMPVPVEPESMRFDAALSGPAAMAGGDTSTAVGNVLLAPRGGAMASPRELADREIRKLIRRLD